MVLGSVLKLVFLWDFVSESMLEVKLDLSLVIVLVFAMGSSSEMAMVDLSD